MLGKSFSWASYGNSVIAIVAGLLGEKASKQFEMIEIQEDTIYAGGYLNPFDISVGALILSGLFALLFWDENYGESLESAGSEAHKSGKWYDGLKNAYVTTTRSTDIFLCGAISSLFEGSMYIFVFMWTPALKDGDSIDPPFGLIFSTFMVCCMAGSSLFSIQSETYKTEEIAVAVMGFSAVSMAMIALSSSRTIKFIGMNFFEMAVGMYFPTMGTLKGCIVPEDKRAAIYNLFRIPLNFIVLFSLLTALTPTQSFLLNAAMLGVGTFLMTKLMQRRAKMGVSREAETELLLEEVVSPQKEDSV
jgi:MFS transporter, MFS domain-containing protein family, molybdate-anion transporter